MPDEPTKPRRCVKSINGAVHVEAGPMRNPMSWPWTPILCGLDVGSGIAWPTEVKGSPTCPSCLALLAEHGSVAAAKRALRPREGTQ